MPRHEGVLVPHVVRCCVEEVERRGMAEVGIYRISGNTIEIGMLKAAFDSSKKRHSKTSAFCWHVLLCFRSVNQTGPVAALYPPTA